jgi:hypothetical protein
MRITQPFAIMKAFSGESGCSLAAVKVKSLIALLLKAAYF